MRASDPEVVVDGLYFPECLRWRDGRLWFSDMFAGTVHRTSGTGASVDTVAEVPGYAGGLGWLPGGDLLVVAMLERQVMRVGVDGAVRTHADLRPLLEHPANDMYVDHTGRAFVSGYGYDVDHNAPQQPVQLTVVEPGGSARLSGPGLVFPNGIDRRVGSAELLVAETFADRVSVLPLRDRDGVLGPSRPLATFAAGDGPDGLCADGAGGAWVACAFGQRAVHVTANGELDHVVPMPGRGVLCCLLGGERGSTLYLAIADTDEEYAARHRTGSILAVELS